MHNDPLAYFLTWTCYGSRLHGDDRGTVHKSQAQYGAPRVPPDHILRTRLIESIKGANVVLSSASRQIVQDAISDHCRIRHWNLRQLNVRSNHVHVVVSAPAQMPESVMTQFKSWSTRRLREGGAISRDLRIWTRHGSTRYIWNENELAAACRYVRDAQDSGSA